MRPRRGSPRASRASGSGRSRRGRRLIPPPRASARGAQDDPPPARASTPIAVLKVAGSVLGPATVLTALMFYFGLLHAYWFFGTFGVDYSVFDLSTQDYLVRSADGLFVPLTVVAAVGLVLLWGFRLVTPRLDRTWPAAAAPVATLVLAVLGVALLVVAAAGLVVPGFLLSYVAVPGVALSAGVVLVMAASRLHRWRQREESGDPLPPEPPAVHAAEWTAVFLLGSVGLFWAAADWSAAVGTTRGTQVVASLGTWPDAVLYSDTRLNLSTAGVRELRCTAGEDVAYRYDGMHLIVQAGGQYLFLPTDWPTNPQAMVVPEAGGMRLVFTAHGASRSQTC